MPYYFWIKESRTLYKKIKKYKCVKYDDTLEGKVENQRRHCWYLFFHEYNFRLIYRQGRKNEKQNS